jgi:DNA-binding NarL/FixJ family response regulator
MSEHSSSLRPLPAARKRILLVDDHPVMIEGMSALVSGTPDLEWMGACPSLPAALEILKANLPDLILMDITIDGPNGLVATREISARYPSLPILIFTCNDENIYTPLAMAAGAKGLVSRPSASFCKAWCTNPLGSRVLTPRSRVAQIPPPLPLP